MKYLLTIFLSLFIFSIKADNIENSFTMLSKFAIKEYGGNLHLTNDLKNIKIFKELFKNKNERYISYSIGKVGLLIHNERKIQNGYDNYVGKVYFGNETVLFRNENAATWQSVYLLKEKLNKNFVCYDFSPPDKYTLSVRDDIDYAPFIPIKELQDNKFFTFPYFGEKSKALLFAIGQSGSGGGTLEYIVMDTMSNKYKIIKEHDCGKFSKSLINIGRAEAEEKKDIIVETRILQGMGPYCCSLVHSDIYSVRNQNGDVLQNQTADYNHEKIIKFIDFNKSKINYLMPLINSIDKYGTDWFGEYSGEDGDKMNQILSEFTQLSLYHHNKLKLKKDGYDKFAKLLLNHPKLKILYAVVINDFRRYY